MAAAAPLEPWAAAKYRQVGIGVECRYPECHDDPEPRTPGKSGPAPTLCTKHNNPTDRQFANRAEKRAEAEVRERAEREAAAPPREPLPLVIARRDHQSALFTEAAARAEAAAREIREHTAALLDADRVAEHVLQVEDDAARRITAAEEAREQARIRAEAAGRSAADATVLARWMAVAALASAADRDAAYAEAATALREAAEADRRETAERTGRRHDAEQHAVAQELLRADHRGELERLREDHRGELDQAAERYAVLDSAHTTLTERHTALTGEHGRLQGELDTLRPALQTATALVEQQQRELRQQAEELGSSAARTVELERQLAEHQAAHDHESELLRALLREQTAELARLREPAPAAAAAPTEPGEPEPEEGTNSPGDTGGNASSPADTGAGSGRTIPARPAGKDTADPAQFPVRIIDLGAESGSGWSLVALESGWNWWAVWRDGQRVGTVSGEHRVYGKGLEGWSARCERRGARTPQPPVGQKYHKSREQAVSAVMAGDLAARRRGSFVADPAWTQLEPEAATALAAAAAPLAVAPHKPDSPWHNLSGTVLSAALRTAARAPLPGTAASVGDLALLGGIAPHYLARTKEGRALAAALGAQNAPRPAPAEYLGELNGRNWTLAPDPDAVGDQLAFADGVVVGVLTEHRTGRGPTGRWSAAHRRHPLNPGDGKTTFAQHTLALAALIQAEEQYQPLPGEGEPVWKTIPKELLREVGTGSRGLELNRGRLAQLTPVRYREQLHQALREAVSAARTGWMPTRHLIVLLNGDRRDLGATGNVSADRLADALDSVREFVLATPVPVPEDDDSPAATEPTAAPTPLPEAAPAAGAPAPAETSVRAVPAALPSATSPLWRTVPGPLREELRDAARSVHVDQVADEAVRSAVMQISLKTFLSPVHLRILLAADRDMLGPGQAADCLFEAAGRLRDHVVPPAEAPAPTPPLTPVEAELVAAARPLINTPMDLATQPYRTLRELVVAVDRGEEHLIAQALSAVASTLNSDRIQLPDTAEADRLRAALRAARQQGSRS